MAAEKLDNTTAKIPWAHFRVAPFPHIALRVLESVNGDAASMCHLSDLIAADPAFSSEVLTIANSPLIAHRFGVTSILQAIALLGTHRLKGLCLTVGVRAYLGKSMNYPTLRNIWRHSMATALIAEQLVLVGLNDEDTAYTAGILHEIGRFALAVIRPNEYACLLDSHAGTAESILPAERELFGLDHREVGLNLVTEWKLPPAFAAIVSMDKSARRKSFAWTMPELVQMSCKMADAAGFPAFAACEATPYQELLEELPPSERTRFYASASDLAFDIGRKISAAEAS